MAIDAKGGHGERGLGGTSAAVFLLSIARCKATRPKVQLLYAIYLGFALILAALDSLEGLLSSQALPLALSAQSILFLYPDLLASSDCLKMKELASVASEKLLNQLKCSDLKHLSFVVELMNYWK